MQLQTHSSLEKLVFFIFLAVQMFSAIVHGFKGVAPRHERNLILRTLSSRQSFERAPFGERRSSFDRPPRNFGGGGGRGRGSGGRGSFTPSDPFAKLNFKETIKIDPELKTPISEMDLSKITEEILTKKGFLEMTPVQSQSYKLVYDGNDVVARSRTGTGKTFAFGLPLIEKIIAEGTQSKRSRLPAILILEPTRELAMQVAQELSTICRPHRLKVSAVYGGVSFRAQEIAFQEGVNIIVGTPGRILDHISRGTVDLSEVQHVVLDEGDTMLEMGFQKPVETIILSVKSSGEAARGLAAKSLASFDNDEDFNDDDTELQAPKDVREVQMLLFSATMPAWICKIADKLMREPVFLDAVQEGETRLANTISHYAIPLPPSGQNERGRGSVSPRILAAASVLEDIIMSKGKGGQSIIFANIKEDCNSLIASNAFSRLQAAVIHGDITQQQRQDTLRAFKERRIDVLVATDVAARGLDIAGVDLVVHVALPNDADSYVHRSGRTGRAGRSGAAVALYYPNEALKLKELQRSLMFKFEHVGLPDVSDIVQSYVGISEAKMRRVSNEFASRFLPFARDMIAKAKTGELSINEEEIDAESEDVADEVEQNAAEGLLARALAAMTNREGFSSRSMISGEEDRVTLSICIEPKNSEPPSTVNDFQRILRNFLSKKLEMDDFRLHRSLIGRTRTEGGQARTVFLQDFDSDVAEAILAKMRDVNVAGLTIESCKSLPAVVENSENDRDRFDGRSHRGGGGDSGMRSDYRGGRGDSGMRSDYRGGRGDSRSDYRGGGGRDRQSSEDSFSGSRKVWQSGFNGRR